MQPQPMQQPLLNLTAFTIDEVNTIFAGLDELQQKRSRPVTDKIIAQVNAQLRPPIQAPAAEGGAVGSSDQTEIPPGANGGVPAGLSDPE